LFLGAGSVIHGLNGEQDLRRMGGLAPRMLATTLTMAVGGAGLAGFPLFAGFFSKDEILAAEFGGGHYLKFLLLLAGALLTAFYTFRLLILAFFGAPRMSKDVARHVHESPAVMTIPLFVLSILTVVAGLFLDFPSAQGTLFMRFLAPVFPTHEAAHSMLVPVLSVVVFLIGVAVAIWLYTTNPVRPEAIGAPSDPLRALLVNAYYIDWFYDRVIVRPILALSGFLARAFDQGLIDGLVNGAGRAVVAWAGGLRRLQTGYIVNYALTMLAGAVILVGFFLVKR
jgi:NADH-quinone oxidoreductase subunit L